MSTAPADSLRLSTKGEPSAVRRPRRRWELWRSPEGQPPWARPALLGVAAVAALLYAWNITRAGFSPFYPVAVTSMSESWKAFFFGAFDPQATVTIDKLAGSFLPQALSVRIFGLHPWALALPQVVEGVVSVLAMYRVVRRWAGVAPGLLAAAIFTCTPIAASMFGHSMEDGALTMCLVLAADAWQRAVTQARLRSLVWAGVWVGLGFQAKMLQAWMILPALAIGYLVAAPVRPRRRLWQLGTAGAAMMAVSLSWIALYTFTPAGDRPYVDGSTDNSAVAMVFGYNGLERFGISVPGAVKSGPGIMGGRPDAGRAAAEARHAGGGFGTGWTKLLGSRYGPQIGWLYPLAILALIFGLIWTREDERDDRVRGGFVMWGVWLLTFGLTFSEMGQLPHTAYLASLAPPLAALSAAGIVMFWREYRAGGGRGWILPAAVAAETAWALFLWRDHGGFLSWARAVAIIAGVFAVLVLVAAKVPRPGRARLASAGSIAGVAAMLVAPVTWAASVLDVTYAGSSFDAGAGPAGAPEGETGGFGGASPAALAARLGIRVPGAGAPGGAIGHLRPGAAGSWMTAVATTLDPAEQRIDDYVSAHRHGAGYLLAVSSWGEASPYILATGQEVMPMGGFSGSVPEPTLARVEELVRGGRLRFFLLDGPGGALGPQPGRQPGAAAKVRQWVEGSCARVAPTDYGAGPGGMGTLYECTAGADSRHAARAG